VFLEKFESSGRDPGPVITSIEKSLTQTISSGQCLNVIPVDEDTAKFLIMDNLKLSVHVVNFAALTNNVSTIQALTAVEDYFDPTWKRAYSTYSSATEDHFIFGTMNQLFGRRVVSTGFDIGYVLSTETNRLTTFFDDTASLSTAANNVATKLDVTAGG